MNSVFLFCCFLHAFPIILQTVEKPSCKNGMYYSWFPLAVFATLDWKVRVSISSDLAADGWGSATWTLRAGQAGHLSSCELSPELSEFQLPSPRVSLQPPQQGCWKLLGRAAVRKLWNGTGGRGSKLLDIWFLVSLLLFKHCGPFTSTQLGNLGTWAGASKLRAAGQLCCSVHAGWFHLSHPNLYSNSFQVPRKK